MPRFLRRWISKILTALFPRFAVWRARQMVTLYANSGLSAKRLAMLEADARKAVRSGKPLDALRILHCALLLNPEAPQIKKFAKKLVVKRWKLSSTKPPLSEEQLNFAVDLKIERFAIYVMQSIDRGGFAKAKLPE
ncbi:MAG: hypothetical protein FJ076_09045 [Cyanobacteria bacterium K_DeepCast_35m_m1_288]|nr:hypothetical protein [Cyanobacteria bacterium K_DeepCast_35m_m1_288]